MLAAVRAHREETGLQVHCRIGIGAGQLLAGVLSRLQPRFHIFGPALREAEHYEQVPGRLSRAAHAPRGRASMPRPDTDSSARTRSLSTTRAPPPLRFGPRQSRPEVPKTKFAFRHDGGSRGGAA